MKKEYIVLDSCAALEKHYQKFKWELAQVLLDYELLNQTKLWEDVQKGLIKSNGKDNVRKTT